MNNSVLIKKLISIFANTLPIHKIPILKEWITSSDKWASKNLLLSSEWVEKFINYLEEENTQLDRFYIYLYGILVDLNQKTGDSLRIIKKSRLQNETKLNATVERLFKDQPQSKKFFLLLVSNADILKKMLLAIKEENLFKIIYLRNKYSHPFLTEYMVKTYMNEEGNEVTFDAKKYKKFLSEDVDELDLTDNIKNNLTPLKTDLQLLSSNLNEMRLL